MMQETTDQPGSEAADLPVDPRPETRRTRLIGLAPYLLLALVVGIVYGDYISRGGWYLDDWSFYASMNEARADGFGGMMRACQSEVTGGRNLACLYHASVFGMFGEHQWLYHAWSAVCLWGMGALGYAILRRCGAHRALATLAMVFLILYPSSDATRLWPVAAVGQYVMIVYLAGLLVALQALKMKGRWRFAVHGLSLGLLGFALLTYEIVVPLVALNGLVYAALVIGAGASRRAAALRALSDFALAGVIGLLRVTANSTADVFVVERTSSESIARLRLLLHRSWDVWHETFLPGTAGLLVTFGIVVGALVVVRAEPTARRRVGMYLLAFGACGVVVAATAAAYLSANDYYVPDQASTANRVNLAGSLAGALAFALLIAMVVAGARALRLPRAGLALAAALVVVSALRLFDQSELHQRRWEEAARVTNRAVEEYPAAMRTVPRDARVLGFDTPQWEAGWIPVFATTWDLEGAIRWATTADPESARPASADLTCGARGVQQGDQVVLPYDATTELWFVSPARRTAREIENAQRCKAVLGAWGAVPFWGRTVTEPSRFD